jgi:DNA (cytosine-5)-methyltransferase 3A
MNVLSLFDGISCARVALDRAGIAVNCYLAAEIDKNAIKISEKNYPDIIRVGSVVDLEIEGQIDLLIGGSPCQDLSIAKKDRKGLDGDRSGLFWEYVRLKNECKPQWFILENVASMPKADRDIITKEMGVDPVMFNASLVSAQCRKRLFWTNIPFDLPEDRGILLKDILQPDGEVDERMVVKGKSFSLGATYSNTNTTEVGVEYSVERKQRTMVKVGERIRKLTPIECERLQGLPDNYTEGVATTNRYKCLGNAFNVDVIAHILGRVKLMY